MKQAIIDNDIAKVRRLLPEYGDINNEVFIDGKRLIDYSLEKLLANGNEWLAIVQLLLEAGGRSDNIELLNRSLIFAASRGHAGIVGQILGQPAPVADLAAMLQIRDGEGKTALMHAAANNKLVMVRQLLDMRGIDVNAVDSSGKTALMHAMECRHISIAECLLEVNNISINAISKSGKTAFDFFGFTENDAQAVSLVESFLKKEAITAEYFLQRRAEVSKSRYSDTESRVPDRLMARALINLASSEDDVAISHAVKLGYKVDDAFKIAIERNRILNAETDAPPDELLSITNTSPLSNPVVNVLLRQDPAVVLRVLMEAASVGDIDVVNTLLEMSRVGIIVPEINIDAPDENGKTALVYAVERGHSSIVASLLGVQEQNQTSVLRLRSCLYRILATTQGEDQTNAVRVLAKQNTVASSMVLIDAATTGNIDLVRYLLRVPGIDVNIQDENGKTALMHAAKNGHRIIVMMLSCVPGIDLSVKDNNGNTAAMHAAQSGYSDIEKDLLVSGLVAYIKKIQSMCGMVDGLDNVLSLTYLLTNILMFCISVGFVIITPFLAFGRGLLRIINVSEFGLPIRGMASIGQDAPLPAANTDFNLAAADPGTPAQEYSGTPAQDAPLPSANNSQYL